MSTTTKFFINQSNPDTERALVASFTSTAQAQGLMLTEGDSGKTIELHFLKENPDDEDTERPFVYEDPTGWTVKFAVGEIGDPVNSGTFTLTDPVASQTTAAIAYNASAASVQTILRAGCATNYGSATVTGNDGGPWTINRGTTGAIATNLTGSAAGIDPENSTLRILKLQTGTASINDKFHIQLKKAAAVLKLTGWSALPSATVTPSIVQAGSAVAPKANKIFRVQYNADAYAGSVSFLFTGDTTAGTVSWKYNATADEVKTAWELHTDVEDDGVTVTKSGPGDFTIELVGAGIKESNVPTLANSSNTLSVPVGLTGTINVLSAGVVDLLNGATRATTNLEIEKTVTGDTTTVAFRSDTLLRAELINSSPGTPTGTDPAFSQTETNLYFGWNGPGRGITGLTGGGATNLDGIATVDYASLMVFVDDATHGPGWWLLKTGSTAENAAAGIVHPDDRHAVTNNKIWERKP